MLTTELHLAPKLRMSGAITYNPPIRICSLVRFNCIRSGWKVCGVRTWRLICEENLLTFL